MGEDQRCGIYMIEVCHFRHYWAAARGESAGSLQFLSNLSISSIGVAGAPLGFCQAEPKKIKIEINRGAGAYFRTHAPGRGGDECCEGCDTGHVVLVFPSLWREKDVLFSVLLSPPCLKSRDDCCLAGLRDGRGGAGEASCNKKKIYTPV